MWTQLTNANWKRKSRNHWRRYYGRRWSSWGMWTLLLLHHQVWQKVGQGCNLGVSVFSSHKTLPLWLKKCKLVKLICNMRKPLAYYRILISWQKNHQIGLAACVLITNLLEATLLTLFCTQDLAMVIVQYGGKRKRRNVTVVSVYLFIILWAFFHVKSKGSGKVCGIKRTWNVNRLWY